MSRIGNIGNGPHSAAKSTSVVFASDGSPIPVTIQGGAGGDATAANQVTGNDRLATIVTNTNNIATAANQTTANASLASIATNTTNLATAANQSTANSSLATIATNTGNNATSANQATANASLATIATNTANNATAANQATANSSLATIATNTASNATSVNQTNKTQMTRLTDGTSEVNILKGDGTITGQNAELVAGNYLSVPFTTTTAQAMAVTDCGNYRWVSVQVAANGTNSNVMFQSSNDGTNWVTNTLTIAGSGLGTQIQGNTTTTGMFFGPITGRYFRINIASITALTTSGVVLFSSLPSAFPQLTVSSSQAGAYTTSTASTATAPAISQVVSNAATVTLKASNTSRKALLIHNGGTTILYVKLGATASLTSFSYPIPTGGFWEIPKSPVYSGVVDGIWEGSPTGSATITEIV